MKPFIKRSRESEELVSSTQINGMLGAHNSAIIPVILWKPSSANDDGDVTVYEEVDLQATCLSFGAFQRLGVAYPNQAEDSRKV